MFCTSTSYFLCIFVVVVTAADPESINGSDSETIFSHLRTDNLGSPDIEGILEFQDTAAVNLQPPAGTSSPALADSGATPTTQPYSDHSSHSRTPAAAALPKAACRSHPLNDTAISLLRSLPEEEKGRRLFQAAKQGAVENLLALLAAGADVGARDEYRETPLHWAAVKGHVEAVRCLLAAGAEVDARSSKQSTPLHLATANGHVETVRCLLEGGADVNARNTWQKTPLHWAGLFGRAAVARLLAAAAANLNARDNRGWTPLHFAAFYGHAQTATALMEAGADTGAKTNDGKTPLDLARLKNHHQLIDILEEQATSLA